MRLKPPSPRPGARRVATYWYFIPGTAPRKPEIGSYRESGGLTDLSRGVFLAYANKGLVTGFSSQAEAERWRDERVYDEATDTYGMAPPEGA